MTPSQQLARARTCVQICFADQQTQENQTSEGQDIEFRESIFICEGFYRGRRFRTPTVTAVWFAEEDELKIHSVTGVLLACLNAEDMAELVSRQETADVLPMRPIEQPQPAQEPTRRAA